MKLIYFDLRADTVNAFCVLENCSLRTFGNECLCGLRTSYVINDKDKSSIFLFCTLMDFSCSKEQLSANIVLKLKMYPKKINTVFNFFFFGSVISKGLGKGCIFPLNLNL